MRRTRAAYGGSDYKEEEECIVVDTSTEEDECIVIDSSADDADDDDDEDFEEDDNHDDEDQDQDNGDGVEDDDDDSDGYDDGVDDSDDDYEEEDDDNDDDDDDDQDKGKNRTKPKPRVKKADKSAKSITVSSGDDQKLFSEALNLLRKGDAAKLKLEHCKAYLRHYSLRLTGSKKTLLDRVQEHVELKAYGGMTKYPRETFRINCTGDACIGDIVLFKQKVKSTFKKGHKNSTRPYLPRRIVAGRIVKESYGSDKQQHTFTVEVLWSRGPKTLPVLYPLLIKGRNLYRLRTFRQQWPNEEERKRVLQEKHSRGNVARKAREDRVSGKRHSCTNQSHLSERKGKATLKREKTSQINATVSSSRQKAESNNTKRETVFQEGRMDMGVASSSHRQHQQYENGLGWTFRNMVCVFQEGRMDKSVTSLSHRQHPQYENGFCWTSRNTVCVLSMNAGFVGLLVGSQGRNIGAITRASGARVQICENPLNPSLRLVEITGVPEQVQVATGMVMRCFLDRGLPPPIVARV